MIEEQFVILAGNSVGKFKLGSKINDILDLLAYEYPRVNFNLQFSSLPEEISIFISDWQLYLRFQSKTQCLYLIDILSIHSIPYLYNGALISQPQHTTTFKSIQKLLGPTFPGKFIEDGFYLLQFDGIGLLFSIPAEFQSLYSDGENLPIELPNGNSPPLNRIYIFPFDYNLLNTQPYPDVVLPRIFVDLKEPSLKLSLNDREGSLSLGMCPQEVISNIGSPDFCALSQPNSEILSHYFEYRSLGLVVYFSASIHEVSQIVLYTNLPNHPDFGQFQRCDFKLTLSQQNSESISPDTPWNDAEQIIGKWLKAGFIGGESQSSPPAAINPPPLGCPFPPTKLHSFNELNLIVEVTDSGGIASVVIMRL